jgi:hypothetical protein
MDILKGLSYEIEMNYKLYKSTEPTEKMNLLKFLKLLFSSCIFILTFSFFQYPLTTAQEGNQYPLAKDLMILAIL